VSPLLITPLPLAVLSPPLLTPNSPPDVVSPLLITHLPLSVLSPPLLTPTSSTSYHKSATVMEPQRDFETAIAALIRDEEASRRRANSLTGVLRWETLTAWSCQDPFIGILAKPKAMSSSEWAQRIYKTLGQANDAPHPCKPRDAPSTIKAALSFSRFAPHLYTQSNIPRAGNEPAGDDVSSVSRELYPLLPDSDIARDMDIKAHWEGMEMTAATVCREILAACTEVSARDKASV
jgi:hypothetical protein